MSARAGLSTTDIDDIARLAHLATNPHQAAREEIYLAVISLYRVQAASLGLRERALMNDILRRLEKDVRVAVRVSLAERLADDSFVPLDVVLLLATDVIDVARPIIAKSPLLTDAHCISLIVGADEPRCIEVASRAAIGEAVSEKLAGLDIEAVLLVLVRNASARLSKRTLDLLAEKARHFSRLCEPLGRRTDLLSLTPELRVPGAFQGDRTSSLSAVSPPAKAESDVETDGADRLVSKLASSGQLRAGFLLRVLQQGQLGLFDAGLARLLDLPLARSREQFYDGGPATVALACRAVGIDRCVFPTVYTLSRRSRGMAPDLTQSEKRSVEEVFRTHSKPAALALLRAA